MMQAQLDRTRAETNAIRDAIDKAERVLEGLSSLTVDDGVNVATPEEEDDLSSYAEIWALMDEA